MDSEKKLSKVVNKKKKQIKALYDLAIEQASIEVTRIKSVENMLFAFDKNPVLSKKLNEIIETLNTKIYAVLVNGIDEAWELAMKETENTLTEKYKRATFPEGISAVIYDKNQKALDQFIKRKTKGIDLSDRVWKSAKQFRTELTNILSVGISEGKSSAEMARSAKRYLNEPEKLFRRVRNAKGNLVFSKAANLYNPGHGVYRSSYKNALRLTRTEINLAYSTSDMDRWSSLDIVVGYEVKLSLSHPRFDICDNMVGKYPKSFKFTKWHPQCLCFAVPILLNNKEFDKYETDLLNGNKPDLNSKNKVEDVPDGFKNWVKENKERVSGWNSKPYWVKENFKYGNINKGLK
jgi:hypothetical protein